MATPACHDIMMNGGFESGEDYWNLKPYYYIPATVTGYPYSGSYALRLGDKTMSVRSWEYTIPADALAVGLGYARSFSGTTSTFHAKILADTETLELERLSLSAVGFGWNAAVYDLTSLRGHTAIFEFGFAKGSSGGEYVYIDDVVLLVCMPGPVGPPPTPRPSPTPSPTLTPTPTATPYWLELVQDGGFEDSTNSPWQTYATDGHAVLQAGVGVAGSRGAVLGGYTEFDDSISQSLVIPAGAQTGELQFGVYYVDEGYTSWYGGVSVSGECGSVMLSDYFYAVSLGQWNLVTYTTSAQDLWACRGNEVSLSIRLAHYSGSASEAKAVIDDVSYLVQVW